MAVEMEPSVLAGTELTWRQQYLSQVPDIGDKSPLLMESARLTGAVEM